MRSRLRSLFVPTDAGDAIAELIAEHSRALETRAEELQAAVADLEQREARARELHARIEQVLREGSAELDIRHSDIVVRAAELDRRETTVAEAAARVEDRARSLGAVELKAAALERREQALREREQALVRREQEIDERAGELERRTDLVEPSRDEPETSHVVLTIDNGYRVFERDGAAPAAGDAVELEGSPHRCVRVTASPYPDDRRRCAVLERV
jgi:chromosome segregation ATPase